MTGKLTPETFAQRAAALRPRIEELSRQIAAASTERAKVVATLGGLVDAQEGTGKREAAAKAAEGPRPPGKLTFRYVPIASLQPPTHLPDGREMSLSMQPSREQALAGFHGMLATVDALLATGVDLEMQIGVYGDPAKMQARAPLEGPAASAFLAGTASVDAPHLHATRGTSDADGLAEAVRMLATGPNAVNMDLGNVAHFTDEAVVGLDPAALNPEPRGGIYVADEALAGIDRKALNPRRG